MLLLLQSFFFFPCTIFIFRHRGFFFLCYQVHGHVTIGRLLAKTECCAVLVDIGGTLLCVCVLVRREKKKHEIYFLRFFFEAFILLFSRRSIVDSFHNFLSIACPLPPIVCCLFFCCLHNSHQHFFSCSTFFFFLATIFFLFVRGGCK